MSYITHTTEALCWAVSAAGRGLGHGEAGRRGQRLLLGLPGDADSGRLPGVKMAAQQVSTAGLLAYVRSVKIAEPFTSLKVHKGEQLSM